MKLTHAYKCKTHHHNLVQTLMLRSLSCLLLDLLDGVVFVEHFCRVSGPHLRPTILAHVVHCKYNRYSIASNKHTLNRMHTCCAIKEELYNNIIDHNACKHTSHQLKEVEQKAQTALVCKSKTQKRTYRCWCLQSTRLCAWRAGWRAYPARSPPPPSCRTDSSCN